ncbi:MAG: 5-(carboxyamino)imidazole ribonucleotide synthase [Pseudomonadota bacterium]
MTKALEPGARIGILGGGQLGRMLSVAAARLGMQCHIFEPAENPPAQDVAAFVTTAPWTKTNALKRFGQSVDVVTYEFENVPTDALDTLEAQVQVWPPRRALAVSQDRLIEKEFLTGLGLATAPFAPIVDVKTLGTALGQIGTPAILKTRRFGYDGKGQVHIDETMTAHRALDAIAGKPAILEGFVPFSAEISVIAARSQDGQIAAFDPAENVHSAGILRTSRVPANVPRSVSTDAVLLAGKILNKLEYVGVIGIELFVTPGGLMVNEFAPRVHNSGHWTMDGCAICQFEQHIRAVAGWPLGDGARHSDVEMQNLIGNDVAKLPALAREARTAVHIYGKSEVRDGRKMGHVNRILGPA